MARFVKGQSGNPSGRSKALRSLEEAARAHTLMGIKVLAEIAQDSKQPGAARVAAVNALHDRGHGKPTQRQEIAVTADLAGTLEKLRSDRGGSGGGEGGAT